eukprot:jgi/Botrbrau1/3354/Bobra.0048s0048.1
MNHRSISAFWDEEGHQKIVERPKVLKKSNAEDRQTARRTSDDDKIKLRESRVRFSDDGPTTSGNTQADALVKEFHDALARNPNMAVAVAAIRALTSVVKNSSAQTMMGLEKELKDAAASLESCNPTAISLKAGCELFLRYTTRTSALESENFADAKNRIIERGDHFADTSNRARQTIAELGARFIRSGSVVLTHGNSRVVLALLRKAASQGIQFSVVVTEGRPDATGLAMAKALDESHIPVLAILDCAVAYALEALRVDMVLVGAEGVVESGGIINKMGTYTLAIAANSHNTPFYVAAESYKFARLYPLNQRDLPIERKPVDFGPLMPSSARIESPSRDYTPPKYISLLFTDLGVLTPAAVSDELIQLYV